MLLHRHIILSTDICQNNSIFIICESLCICNNHACFFSNIFKCWRHFCEISLENLGMSGNIIIGIQQTLQVLSMISYWFTFMSSMWPKLYALFFLALEIFLFLCPLFCSYFRNLIYMDSLLRYNCFHCYAIAMSWAMRSTWYSKLLQGIATYLLLSRHHQLSHCCLGFTTLFYSLLT